MPNRYSLDLRPRQRGPDAGDYLNQGIANILGYRERERQEENRIRAAGGVPVESRNPGIAGRLRGIGQTLRRNIFGDQQEPDVDQQGGPSDMDRDDRPRSTMDDFAPERSPFGGVMANGSDAPRQPGPGTTPPILSGADPRDRRSFGRLPMTRDFGFDQPAQPTPQGNEGGGRIFAPGSVSGARPRPMAGQTPAFNGNAPDPRASIANRLRRPGLYTQRTEGGQTYTMDPMYASNLALAGKEDEYQLADSHRHQTEEDQIAALTAAGMPAAEARARVLNNVVRYDEEFGQRFRPGGAGGAAMTQAERLQIQDRLDARARRAQQIQLILQDQRNMSAEKRAQLNAEIAQLNREAANDRALLNSAQNEANNAASGLTRMQTDVVTANTPAGQAAITEQKGKAAGAKAAVDSARTRLQPKRKLTQQQYDQARAKYTDAQIAAGYDLSGVKRKP